MRAILILRFLACLLLGVALPAGALAQAPAATNGSTETTPPAEKDQLGRDTTQGLVSGLIGALSSGDYERAVPFLEVDRLSAGIGQNAVTGATLAEHLQRVLDRSGSVLTVAELATSLTGRADDGLPADLERIGTLGMLDGEEKPLLAHHLERDGKQIWVISVESLRDVEALTRASSNSGGSLLERMPQGPTIFGAPLSHWAALIVLVVASFGLAWVLTAARGLFIAVARRYFGESSLTRFVNASAGPVRLLLAAIIFGIAIRSVGVAVVVRYYATFLNQMVGLLAVAWLLWRSADAGAEVMLSGMSRRGKLAAYSAVSFMSRAVKGVLAVVFIVVCLNAFGFDVTTGLAALGVGGLAIALGAQKLFENLIGSLTLIADRPVRIGDFCRFGDSLGTVEEIGIRSTRIRTLDRTVLTVPNGEFSALHIENYSQRDRYWFNPTLNLRYETSPDQFRYLLQELRAMLYAHPKVDPDPARVRLVALAAYSIDIEIFAYVHASDYHEFLEVQEDLLLRCMEIVEKSGTGFAFPSQTLYLGRDTGLEAQKTKEAEETVERRRENGEMQVPRFRPETIRELRNSIEYPPRGAAVKPKARS